MAESDEQRRQRNREYMRRRRAADPEKYREQGRAYRRANPEKQAEWSRRWRERHAEELRAKRREKAEANKEYQRQYYADRREQKRAASREWYKANRDRQLVSTSRSRLLRLHGLQPGSLIRIWQAQGEKCYLCGRQIEAPGQQGTDLDHDHRCCGEGQSCSYCRRGLACHSCNVIIGFAEDDVERLIVIAANLRAARADVTERLKTKPRQDSLLGDEEEAS